MAYKRTIRRKGKFYKGRKYRKQRKFRKGKMWKAGSGIHSAYSCRDRRIQKAMWG